MKKTITIIIIIAIIAAAVAGIAFVKISKDKEQKEIDKHLTYIEDFDDFKTMIENKEDFLLIITGSECSHCEQYLPVFKKVLKDYDIYAYQIHQDKLETADLGYLKSVATISGTPTVVSIINGEEASTLNRIVGDRSRSYTIDKLKTMGYIKD